MNRIFKKAIDFLKIIMIALCLTGCAASLGTTPVNEADVAAIENAENEITASISASSSPAIYTDGTEPKDATFAYEAEDGVEMRYTTNSSAPTKDSNKYEAGTALELDYIDTGDGTTKQAILRCALFKYGEQVSEVCNFVYMSAPEGRFEMPVYSIISDKKNFYSNDTGILVPGKLGSQPNPPGWQPWYTNANYYGRGIEWERPIGLTVFREDGTVGLNVNCGVRVSGGYTRVNKQKSLRLYARKAYTPDSGVFEYSFWDGLRGSHTGTPVAFSDTVLLRGGSNNEGNAIFTTPALLMLLEGTDLDRPAISPIVEYINGRYYGIVMLLEDYDTDFFLANYGVPEEYLTTLKGTAPELYRTTGWYLDDGPEGEVEELYTALKYIVRSDMTDPECYKKATEMIDIQNFIEYIAFEAYTGNTDWPDNNLRAWRYNKNGYDPDAEGVFDGRWRFLTKDLDLSFGYGGFDASGDPYSFMKGGSALLLKNVYNSLMKNSEFQDLYYNYMCTLAEAVVSPERCEHTFDLMQVYFGKETAVSISSVRVGGGSRGSWNAGFDVLRKFAISRASNILKYTKNYSKSRLSEISVETEGEGNVRLGWFAMESGESRSYLVGRKIPLELTPAEGYEIGEVTYEECSLDDDGYLIAESNTAKLKVTFVQSDEEAEEKTIVINEVMFRGTDYKWTELYNTTDKDITLSGWSLGKKKNPKKAVQFETTTIPANSYALICSTDYSNSKGIEGLSVTLSIGNNDDLYLFDENGDIVDMISLSTPSKTVHVGRIPDGGAMAELSREEATPGEANFMAEDKSTYGSDAFKPYLLVCGRAYDLDEAFYEKDGVMYVSKSKLMEIISQNQSCAEIYRYLRKQNGDITLDALIEGSDYNQGASVRYLPELDSVIIG